MKEKNSLVLNFCWPFRSTSHILLLPQKVHYLLLDTLITLLDIFSKKSWDNWCLNLVPKLSFLDDLGFKSLYLHFFPVSMLILSICILLPLSYECLHLCVQDSVANKGRDWNIGPISQQFKLLLEYWWCNDVVGSFVLLLCVEATQIVTW